MAKRVHLSENDGQDERELRDLLEKFMKKSEELEKRESRILKQVELVQSAVASLQVRQQDVHPATSTTSSDSLHLDLKKIEEETQEIKEETERIQQEVRQKIEENKKLQDEIDRRKTQKTGKADESVTGNFFRRMNEEAKFRRMERKEIESRATKNSEDPGIHFFNDRLEKLKQLEKKVKRELEEEAEEAKKKRTPAKMDALARDVKKKPEKQQIRP